MEPRSTDAGGAEFARTATGKGRHIVRVRPRLPYPWPAVSWCGRRLVRLADDAHVLCGMCEQIHAGAQDRARRSPDPTDAILWPTDGTLRGR